MGVNLPRLKDFKQRLFFLIVSLIMNSVGTALTISTNMGSAVWSASSVNLANWIGVPLGTTMFCYGVLVTIANQLFIGHFDRRRFISNLMFTVPFSYLVQYVTTFWDWIGVPRLNLAAHIILDVIGIAMISAAVSIYQRSNLIMHPNDDLSYILRFKFMHNSAVMGQWASYIPPVVVTVLAVIFTHQIYAVNFGTILALVAQGEMMKWSDTHVFPRLKHHVDIGVRV